MPYGMTLWRPAFVAFNGNQVTDHNRSAVGETVERIGGDVRTARGTKRAYYVADKRTFDMSWDFIPGPTAKTVDGKWGADAIIEFYGATTGAFVLSLVEAELNEQDEPVTRDYEVLFENFSHSVEKRWSRYFYNISLTLEEV